MIKNQTNAELAATLINARAFEERAGSALCDVARAAGMTMTNFCKEFERHPAVIRWMQAVGRGSTVRLVAHGRVWSAIEDHAMIETLRKG